jgi:hypothetical protein
MLLRRIASAIRSRIGNRRNLGDGPLRDPVPGYPSFVVDDWVRRAYEPALVEISIRARTALCLCLAESLSVHSGALRERCERFIDAMWDFVETGDVSEWESDERLQSNIVPLVAGLCEWRDSGRLPEEISALDQRGLDYVAMLSCAHASAVVHMYGALSCGYGRESAEACLAAIALAVRLGASPPALDRFAQSTTNEEAGWGNPHWRSFYRDR